MTSQDLENLRSKHELAAKAAYEDCAFSDYNYEMGYVAALNHVLEHSNELYLGQRRQNLVEDAEDHIYSYFESRYDGDDSDELPETLEERYQRALDEGDAERLAEIFQNKYDPNFSEDFQWDAIVEDFYDFYEE